MPESAIADRQGSACVSVVTVSELLQGVHLGSPDRKPKRRAFVDRILRVLDPIPIDTEVARTHSELWAELTSIGALIGSHDLWIAATAVTHDFEVLTLNVRDFERVPGLRVVRA